MPKLSIIVPVYKTEAYLGQCVESILAQTFADFELILVDNDSPDNCPALCEAWAKKDSRIRVLHQENRGPQGAVAAGAQCAAGQYLAFVDSDDWIEPEMLATLLAAAEKENADMVQCGLYRCIGAQRQACSFAPHIYGAQEIQDTLIPSFFAPVADPPLLPSRANKLYRRQLVCQALPLCPQPLTCGEDQLLTLAVLFCCQKVAVISDCCYNYRYSENSLTTQYTARRRADLSLLFSALREIAAHYGYTADPAALQEKQDLAYVDAMVFLSTSLLPFGQKRQELQRLYAAVQQKRRMAALGAKYSKKTQIYLFAVSRRCFVLATALAQAQCLLARAARKKAGR